MKKILGVFPAPRAHWVGDGFPVHSMFSYQHGAESMSPFLMLDYAAPAQFAPTTRKRGVGVHPHRGFETVTIVYQGEVDHRDSTGAGGHIGPGDVQWMTAGGGILHEEFHSEAFTRNGGTLEMVQLWVNLPAKDKMSAPGYQTLLDADIPSVPLADEAGRVRVIAGEFDGHRGPARTFTAMDVWDVRLSQGASTQFTVAEGHTLALVVLHGTVLVRAGSPNGANVGNGKRLNGSTVVREAQRVQFDRSGGEVTLEANTEATLLWLSGEPIDEPIVGYGPFVMNTQAEITQAMVDFNGGRFGRMSA